MSFEKDTIHVPSFTLVPICTSEDVYNTGHWIDFACICLHPYTTAEAVRQKMVYDFKPFIAFGIVCAANVHERLETSLAVLFEEDQNGTNSRRRDIKRELVVEDGELLDEFRKTLGEIGAISVEL